MLTALWLFWLFLALGKYYLTYIYLFFIYAVFVFLSFYDNFAIIKIYFVLFWGKNNC